MKSVPNKNQPVELFQNIPNAFNNTKNYFIPPQNESVDGYKLGHISQYIKGTKVVGANMTPRDNKLANTIKEHFDGKIIFWGLQYALIFMIESWEKTFFSLPKEEAMAAYNDRVKSYLGNDHGDDAIKAMSELHDLGYLPLEVKALPEGTRVNMKIPVFTVENTHEDFYWLTNYCETFLSSMVWPMCNDASIANQYFESSKRWAEHCNAPDMWAGISNHCFAARGGRGQEDSMRTGMSHSTSSYGSDTLIAASALDYYYGADSKNNLVMVSINAFEHATATQRIAYYRNVLGFNKFPLEAETESVRDIATNIYPTGLVGYVGDSEDYFGYLRHILTECKPEILARQPDSSGMCKWVSRPDSSPKTPVEIIVGDCYIAEDSGFDGLVMGKAADMGYEWVLHNHQYFKIVYNLKAGFSAQPEASKDVPDEVKGTMRILWEIFGGTPSKSVEGKALRVLHEKVGCIYGEAITVVMKELINTLLVRSGYCVSNMLMGVGSWGYIGNSSRDTYGFALKGTNSVVEIGGIDTEVPMQKNPKTASQFKRSAKGRLRVELEAETGEYVLFDEQSEEQSAMGELKQVKYNGKMTSLITLAQVRKNIGFE